MKIAIMSTASSWFGCYLESLAQYLKQYGEVEVFDNHEMLESAYDVMLILNYFKIIPQKVLDRNQHNLVIHASALPQGKGWSPLTWQILEGMNRIPVTLFEAAEGVDAGDIYGQVTMELDGTELIEGAREKLVEAYHRLLSSFFESYPYVIGRSQVGEESFYARRRPEDSSLDINKSIGEQFNLFRVVDNERYPAYFVRNGKKYTLKIEEMED